MTAVPRSKSAKLPDGTMQRRVHLNITIPLELALAVEAEAKKRGTPQSRLIEEALRKELGK